MKHRELFRTLRAWSPSDLDIVSPRWTHGRKEWELVWPHSYRFTETDPIRDLLNEVRGGNGSFYWKEPALTSRNRVYIGTGTNSRDTWQLPCKGWESLAVLVAGTEVTSGTDFTISSSAGDYGLDNIVFTSPVSLGLIVECNYVNGFLYPIVSLSGDFVNTVVSPGDEFGNISIVLAETKEPT